MIVPAVLKDFATRCRESRRRCSSDVFRHDGATDDSDAATSLASRGQTKKQSRTRRQRANSWRERFTESFATKRVVQKRLAEHDMNVMGQHEKHGAMTWLVTWRVTSRGREKKGAGGRGSERRRVDDERTATGGERAGRGARWFQKLRILFFFGAATLFKTSKLAEGESHSHFG